MNMLKPLRVSDGTMLAVISLACLGTGALLYRLIEAPFMALRDRLAPSNFFPVPLAASAMESNLGPQGQTPRR
jgi:peptidoglycan/LPS O-acetylase OafA/YrhL